MYRKVLVPLDGSPLAGAVLPHVQEIARCTQAEILLFRATPESSGTAAATGEIVRPHEGLAVDVWDPRVLRAWSIDPGHRTAQQVEVAQGYLDEIAAGLRQGGAHARSLVRPDRVAEAILNVADDEGVDLIAMSTHGRSGIGRFLLGSVADKVVHHARVPVLLVRSSSQTEPQYRRILVPLDGSDVAKVVLPYARDLAACAGAEVVLLQVIPATKPRLFDAEVSMALAGGLSNENTAMPAVADASMTDREVELATYLEEVARGQLEVVASELAKSGLRVVTQLQVGMPAETILDFIALERIDLVAMSTHGRSGISRYRLGSVAERVAHHATVPVLLVRASTDR
jgi:nucleotide-binding universal stress UspA family protein